MLYDWYYSEMASGSSSRVWVDVSTKYNLPWWSYCWSNGHKSFGSGVIIFEAVLVSNDGGNLTSTLINLSEVSVLDDSNVTCTVTVSGGAIYANRVTTDSHSCW